MPRKVLAHALDEAREARYQIEHEEQDDRADDPGHQHRGHERLAELHRLFVVPAKAVGESAEHGRELSARLPGAHQIDRHRVERLGMAGHRLGEVGAPFDRFHQAGEHVAKMEPLHRVAKVGEGLGDRHPGGEKLLEVEAEVDELATGDGGTGTTTRAFRTPAPGSTSPDPGPAGAGVPRDRPRWRPPSGRAGAGRAHPSPGSASGSARSRPAFP